MSLGFLSSFQWGMGKPPFLSMPHRNHGNHRKDLAGEEGFKCPAERTEIKEMGACFLFKERSKV